MMSLKRFGPGGILFSALLLLLCTSGAFATPVGTLTTSACAGQGVTVTFTEIDWLPAGGPAGCIESDTPTVYDLHRA
jgi:hypothetical protein